MRTQTSQKAELFARALRMIILGVFAVFVCAFLISLVNTKQTDAATSSTINFQARLENKDGAIVPDGYYNVEFNLYNVSTGGTSEWTEDYTYNNGSASCDTNGTSGDCRVRVSNGYLTVNLGAITAFSGSSINWNQQQWLSMNIGGTTDSGSITFDGEMTPRLQMTATPYAFQAGELGTTNGSNVATLSFTNPTANNSILLPDASGTVCLQGSADCEFLTGSGAGVELQSGTPGTAQSGSFNINGTGIAAILQGSTSVETSLLDTASSGTLSLGTTNATAIDLQQNTTIASGKTLTVNGDTTIDDTLSTSAFQVQDATGSLFSIDAAADQIVLGNDSTATPTDVTVRGGNGSGTNVTGGNLTIAASNGTGTGGSGSIAFQTAAATPAVTYDSSNDDSSGSSTVSSLSWSHTIGSGSNGILIVNAGGGTSGGTADTVSSVTYDGESLTKLTSVGSVSYDDFELWYLLDPPSGSHTVDITMSGSNNVVSAGSVSYFNVDQSNPFGTAATQATASGGSISTSVSTSTDQLVVDSVGGVGGGSAPSPGTGQTANYTLFASGGSSGGSSRKAATGSSTTMSWSGFNSSVYMVMIAVGLNPLESSTTSDTLQTRLDIAANGNVGINTTNPQYTLDVSGSERLQTGSTTAFQIQDAAGSSLLTADTTNGNIQIGSSTTDAVANLLILDSYNSATDPTGGVNGAMYYNTADNTFRCYGDGAWANCGGNGSSSGGYVSLQSGTPGTADTGNFNISGTGIADILQGSTEVETSLLDTASAGTLSIGTTNATVIRLGKSINFAAGARTIYIATGSGAGSDLTIQAESAAGTNHAGGDLLLQGGAATGTGAGGAVIAKSQTNSTSAFQVQDAAGDSALTVDTTNLRVDVGTAGTPTGQLYVSGSLPTGTLGSVNTSGDAYAVYVQGNYAYVGDTNSGGLEVYDVSDPSNPTLISTASTDGDVSAVYVQGHYAYITTGSGGNSLQIFDISNPYDPTEVSEITTGSSSDPEAVYVSGRYAYVAADGAGKMEIFDVNNPAVPVEVGSISASEADGIFVSGRYAYVVTEASTPKLDIFDISDPTSPTSVGNVTLPSFAYSVYVSGRYAYVAVNGDNSLYVYDVSNPASPSSVGNVATDSGPYSITVQGRYAYIAEQDADELGIFDVSNPASPVSVGTVSGSTDATSVFVSGRYAYVATGGSTHKLLTYDLGGSYIQQLEAGSTKTGTLEVTDNANVSGDQSIQGSLTVGQNAQVSGNVGIAGALQVANNNSLQGSPMATLSQTGTGNATLQLAVPTQSWNVGINASSSNSFNINSSTASATSAVNVGNTGTPTAGDTGDTGEMECAEYTATQNGTISSITAVSFHSPSASPNNKFSVALYSGTGNPTTLVAQGTSATLSSSAGPNTMDISATLVAGTDYWMCVNTNSFSSTAGWGYYTTGSNWTYTSQTFGTWPTSPSGFNGGGVDSLAIYMSFTETSTSYLNSLFSLSETGAATFRNSTDSTASLQIQSAGGTALFTVDAADTRIYIGSGTPNNSTTRLVLNNYNGAGEPVEVDGAMYYNTTMNSFRCGENTVWRSCLGGLVNSSTAASSALTLSTAIQNLSGGTNNSYTVLAKDCQPGVTYLITAQGTWTATSTTPTISFYLDEDGTSTNLLSTPTAKAFTSTGTPAGWVLTAQMTCDSTTTVEVQGEIVIGTDGVGTTTTEYLDNTGTKSWTTSSHTLYIGAKASSTTGAPSATMRQFIVQRLGP